MSNVLRNLLLMNSIGISYITNYKIHLKILCQNGSIGIAFIYFRIVITKNKLKFPLSDSIAFMTFQYVGLLILSKKSIHYSCTYL